jgi:hypothetical protein
MVDRFADCIDTQTDDFGFLARQCILMRQEVDQIFVKLEVEPFEVDWFAAMIFESLEMEAHAFENCKRPALDFSRFRLYIVIHLLKKERGFGFFDLAPQFPIALDQGFKT